MRTREKIQEDGMRLIKAEASMESLTIELLLDIRDLLSRAGVQNDFGKAQDELDPSLTSSRDETN